MIGTSEKRSQEVEEFDQKIKVVIVDIEGTTTSISFVKETLFPYIRENLQVYLKNHWKEPEFAEDLSLLRKQAESDKENGVEGLVPIPAGNDENDELCQAVLKNVLWQMDLDRKTKALKQLQGHVMREGYMNGKLKGHVYDDVQPALKSWTHSGRQVYVYSSGSVAAQKLLFGFSEKGDLLEFFSGHFDTEIGPKVESSSYSNITKQLKCKSEEIMFLTDIPKEAMAAREAGMHAVLVARPGNAPLSDDDCHKFRVVKSFDDIVFEASAKRTKLSLDEEPVSKSTVSNESVTNSNSDMQMEVDENEICSKVSEDIPLASETSEDKTNKKHEEVKKLQNGNVQEHKEEKELEASANKDSKDEQDPKPEKDKPSAPEPEADKKASETEGKEFSDSSSKVESCDEKVDNATKTENLKKDEKVVKMETDKNESKETSSDVETVRDSKTAENEKDEKSTVKETESQIQGDQNVAPEETKTVETPENEKTELPSEQITTEDEKTANSTGEPKTVVEVGKVETDSTTNLEKTAGSVEELKTVDSTSEEKATKTERISNDSEKSEATAEGTTSTNLTKSENVETTTQIVISKDDEMKTVDSAKEAKIPDTIKEVPENAKEAKCTEGAQEVKVSEVADQKRTEESSDEIVVSQKTEEVKTADVKNEEKISEEVKSPGAAEETKVDKPVDEVKTLKSAEESKTSETLKEVKAPEIVKEESDTPVTGKSEISKVAEETKTSEVKEAKSEPTSEMNAPEINEKTEGKEESTPKLIEKNVSSDGKGDETMECDDESKTVESPKSEAVENSSDSSAETKKKDSQADVKHANVNDVSKKSENVKEVKKGEIKLSLESSEEKITKNCDKDNPVGEKEVEDKKMVDASKEEKVDAKNGETDVDMETTVSDSVSLNAEQKAENNSTEKKVPMDVGDGEIKTADLSAKKDDAMETDAPDSEHNDVGAPMDVDSSKNAEVSTANGKEDLVEDSKNNGEKEKEAPEAMDSKTNGINSSSETSPKVNCEKNETDSKIIDNENLKLKKTTDEADAAKLNSSPSAQS